MKKILIFSAYGTDVPDVIAKIQSRNAENIRTGKIIEEIEAITTITWFSNQKEMIDCVKANPDALYHLEGTDIYVGWNEKRKCWAFVSIVEIDETQKWIIDEYDGAESIRKLPEYELVNAELNLYAEKSV